MTPPTPLRARSAIGLVAVIALALVIQALQLATPLDNLLLDQQFRLLRRFAPAPVGNDVVVVGIDEKTYMSLPEPFALWHPYLGRLLGSLASAKPAVVGLDIVLPVRSYNFLVPQYDVSLLQGIRTLKAVTPLVLGQSLDENRRFRPIFPPYLAMAGGNAAASVVICVDDDGVVRRFHQDLCVDGSDTASLAGRMAEILGVGRLGDGLIDYSVGAPLHYLSMMEVLDWIAKDDQARLQAAFSGKAVLLGAVLPFEDRHRLPVPLAAWEPEQLRLPGVLIHAQALRSMLKNGLIQPVQQSLLWCLVALCGLFWLHRGSRWKLLLFCLFFPLLFTATLLTLWHGIYVPTASLMLAATLAFFARVAAEAANNYREKQQMRKAFSGYVSAPVLKQILAGKIKPGLGGEKLQATVLFSDIRNFTTRSMTMSPEATIELLNEYFSEMTEAIHKNGGMIDKFIGDGIMASFGAPQAMPNANRCALEAAQDMLVSLARLNRRLVAKGNEPIAIGIGIHAGEVLAGNVGSVSRHEYTLIGDVVNIASRLEATTKELGYPIVCSAAVAASVGGAGGLTSLGEQAIKGHNKLHVYGWRPAVLDNATT